MSGSQSRSWDRARQERRRRIDYPAWIDCGPGEALRNCIIWEISEIGGRITIGDADTVPDEFVLVLSRSGDFGRRCRVLSREPLQVEFFILHTVHKQKSAPADPGVVLGIGAPAAADNAVDLETV